MTYAETLKSAKDGINYYERHLEMQKMAVEALEKQLPKKPFREDGLMVCPVCKRAPFGIGSYCQNCGQRLEWGKIEEE